MADGWLGVTKRDPKSLGFDPKKPWKFACPDRQCYYCVCADTEAGAIEQQETHQCPQTGQTKFGRSTTMTLVGDVWKLLDDTMSTIMSNPTDSEECLSAKIRARALAEVLAIFMIPHFRTPDEVAREAVKRYKAKMSGDTEYCTVGLATRRYEVAGDDKYTSPPKNIPARRASQPVIKMTEQEQAAIQFAHTSGFTVEQLAKTYNVSLTVINAIVSDKSAV